MQISEQVSEDSSDAEGHGQPDLDSAQTTVTDSGGGNSTFVVERKVDIEADNKPHKVTIAVLEPVPRFMYFATPELEDKVYLQVRASNESNYKLLASSKVAVF